MIDDFYEYIEDLINIKVKSFVFIKMLRTNLFKTRIYNQVYKFRSRKIWLLYTDTIYEEIC